MCVICAYTYEQSTNGCFFPRETTMRRPDKTELEFVILMACLVVPFAYLAIRTVLALVGI
jgi:hypothetical protein